MNWTSAAICLAVVVLPALRVHAQTPERVTVFAGIATQPASTSFLDDTSFPFNRETARLVGSYEVGGGLSPDLGASVRVWKGLAAVVSITSVTRATTGTMVASYPHPFFFNVMRQAETALPELERTELGVHPAIGFAVPTKGRLRVLLFAGPSILKVKQSVLNTVTLNEVYPYDSLTISPGATTEISETVVGLNAGADATFYFNKNVGVGGLFRFVQGSKEVAVSDGKAFEMSAGGIQASGGVRFRF